MPPMNMAMGTDQHLPLYRRRSSRRGVGADRHLRPPTATRRSRELTRASRDQLAIERLSPARRAWPSRLTSSQQRRWSTPTTPARSRNAFIEGVDAARACTVTGTVMSRLSLNVSLPLRGHSHLAACPWLDAGAAG